MFGYVTAHQPDLRVSEQCSYKALYCGLCRQLKRNYGLAATMGLSYDLTFLAALGLALTEEPPVMERRACCVYLWRHKNVMEDPHAPPTGGVLHYAAAMQVLLAAAKLEDDLADETGVAQVKARSALALLSGMRKRAAAAYPAQRQAISDCLSALRQAESGPRLTPDGYAHHFARLIGLLCRPLGRDETSEYVCSVLGYQLGRWIYLIDALDDLARDRRLGRFNALSDAVGAEGFCGEELLDDATLAANAALQLLPVRRFQGILENILLQGMPIRARQVIEKSRTACQTADAGLAAEETTQ